MMHVQSEYSTHQQIDEFNRRLSDLACNQRRACVLLFADRLQQELTEQQPSAKQSSPLLARVRRWLRQRWAVQPHKLWHVPTELPDTESVVIIDATYTVVEQVQQKKEKSPWTS
jgi:hypothetical protein